MCSYVSIACTFMNGVEVLLVDRSGRGLLKPQSPLARAAWGVVIVWWMGYGRVALSDWKPDPEANPSTGFGKGAATANIREARSKEPPGETVRVAIVVAGGGGRPSSRGACSRRRW